MKFAIVRIIIMVLLGAGVAIWGWAFSTKLFQPEPVNNSKIVEQSVLTKVTAKDVSSMFAAKEDFIFVFSSSTCINCIEFKPYLEDVVKKEGIQFNVMEVDLDVQEDVIALIKNYLIEDPEVTPITYVVKDGVVVNKILGNVRDELSDKLKEAN